MLQTGVKMQHLKAFFLLVLFLAVFAVIVAVFYAWLSFILIGMLTLSIIAALCYTCSEIWKDIKRKLR